ncbi:MAG: hypothetical protein V3V30_07120 [Parvularculaceae bacterium]
MALLDRIIEIGLTPATIILACLILIVVAQLRWRGPYRFESNIQIHANLDNVWRNLDQDDPDNNVLALGLSRNKIDSDMPTYVTGVASASSTSGYPLDIFSTMIITECVRGSHMVSITQMGTSENPKNTYISRDGSELMYVKTVETGEGVTSSVVSMVQSPRLWFVALIKIANPQKLILRRLKTQAEMHAADISIATLVPEIKS